MKNKLLNDLNLNENNFDFLRFFAACSVLFVHGFALIGQPIKDSSFIPEGVPIFFAISGFLIMKSWTKSTNLFSFLTKRCLRIFPALCAVVLISALIIGPLMSKLSVSEYFQNPLTYKYIKNIFLYKIRFFLPGVFEDLPYPYAVNGSLGSLPFEFFLYVCLAMFGLIHLFRNKYSFICVLVSILFFCLYYSTIKKNEFILFCNGKEFFELLLLFMFSAFLYVAKKSVILNFPLFLFCFILWLIGKRYTSVLFIQSFTLPYIILYIAYSEIPILKHKLFQFLGNISYGLYLWAFVVQQVIISCLIHFQIMPENITFIHIMGFNICSLFITLIIAYLSYEIVEKPFLKLKKIHFSMNILKIESKSPF